MVQHQLSVLVHQALLAGQAAGDLPAFDLPTKDHIPIERPAQSEYGDFATPIAMQLARLARHNPKRIAQSIVTHLPMGGDNLVLRADIAGPGFVNFLLNPTWLAKQVDHLVREGKDVVAPGDRKEQRVLIEFISANPTGPLTVGHGRGAVIGDTLSRILESTGAIVTREYYFNDGGLQMKILAESVRIRVRQLLGEDIPFPEGYYVGDYIRDIAAGLIAEQGSSVVDSDWTSLRDCAVTAIFADIRQTQERLGIAFDTYFNEMTFYDKDRPGNVWDITQQLRACGVAYEEDGAVWFRATAFGADKDRVLIRSTGEPTYRLPDIAYHVDKLKRGFDLIIDVLGSDHGAQYPDIKAAVGALGYDTEKIRVVEHQFVTLIRDGVVVKMSTRRATYVTLDELIDEVGADAVRYFMISRSQTSQFEFDLNLAKAQNDSNPVYYIQYAHARTAGILERTAAEKGVIYDQAGDVLLLQHPMEMALIREILRLEEVILACAQRLETHHLAYYGRDLATAFSAFYRDCRVIDLDNLPLTQARLKLVKATQNALSYTLALMGMSAPSQM